MDRWVPTWRSFWGFPALSISDAWRCRKVRYAEDRTIRDGREIVEAPLPALVTAGDEVGVARYPKLRDIMAAGRKQPVIWNAQDLDIDPSTVGDAGALTKVQRLYVEEKVSECEIIEGESPAEMGVNLALKLRELRII